MGPNSFPSIFQGNTNGMSFMNFHPGNGRIKGDKNI